MNNHDYDVTDYIFGRKSPAVEFDSEMEEYEEENKWLKKHYANCKKEYCKICSEY